MVLCKVWIWVSRIHPINYKGRKTQRLWRSGLVENADGSGDPLISAIFTQIEQTVRLDAFRKILVLLGITTLP